MGIIAMAKDNYFILGGIDSRDYDMVVSCKDAFAMPERDIDTFEVPGKNGELIVDNGRFKNVDITYQVVIESGFAEKINTFKRALGQLRGYVRLEDTFDFDVYRMANVREIKIDELGTRYNGGTFEFKINCKPQKFLKSGEEPICVLEGNFYEYTSSEDEPDIPSSAWMYTGYIFTPTDNTLKVKLHNEKNNASVYMTSYDNQYVKTQIPVFGELNDRLSIGDYETTVTLPADSVRWSFNYSATGSSIGEVVTVGESYVEFGFSDYVYSEFRDITALLKKELRLANPTGYATKPLIEYYAYYNSDIKITNIENGIESEFYELHFATENLQNQHIFLDCDQQYAYNSDGGNVSNIMSIVTAQNAKGRSLVFPELGADVAKIEFLYHADSSYSRQHNTIIFITPRWWSV